MRDGCRARQREASRVQPSDHSRAAPRSLDLLFASGGRFPSPSPYELQLASPANPAVVWLQGPNAMMLRAR